MIRIHFDAYLFYATFRFTALRSDVILVRNRGRAKLLGHTDPEHYVWPACRWHRIDPTKPIKKWDTVWRKLRDKAGPPGLRFHDLRHTIITELAEMGVPDHVMESISGHLCRRMLEHYSHIRLEAKKKVLDALDVRRSQAVESHKAETKIQ